MDVFLVPAGEGRYELYCEPRELDQPDRGGLLGRLVRRFREVMAAEQATRDARPASPEGWVARGRAGLVRGIAEWVASQRLLWHLRHQRAARLTHPADLASDRALAAAHGMLRAALDHHRVWMVVDGVATAVFGPLFFFIPGPNLISWYFAAKMAGHWLAFRGARRGLTVVEWSARASEPLSEVRHALGLPPAERRGRLRHIAAELQLEHLSTFLERTLPEGC